MSEFETIDSELLTRLAGSLRAAGLTVVTAESCTGGGVGAVLTSIAGSSDYFLGGLVTYSNQLKHSLLGVPTAMLVRHGAVSEPVVRHMALAARRRCSADLAIAVSGVAGPGGGSEEKPVGLVCFAWAGPGHEVTAQSQHFAGDRAAVRRQAVEYALHELNEIIHNGAQANDLQR